MRRHLLALGLILGSTIAAYSNCLRNGFVWDDHAFIENNAFVRDPSNLRVLLDPRYYLGKQEVLAGSRPVFLASLMIDRALWGENPAGYHATSVLLHAANSGWVYLLSGALGFSPLVALSAALFFGLHPIQTEAVNLVSFRAELLAAFFLFCALWAYLKTRQGPAMKLLAWLPACAAFLGLALLSKETAAVLPLVILLIELYFPIDHGRRRRLGAAMTAFFILACLYAGFWAPRFRYPGMAQTSEARKAVDRLAAAMPTAPGESDLALGLEKGSLRYSSAWEFNALYADRAAWTATSVKSLAGYFHLLIFPEPLAADRAPLRAKDWKDSGALGGLALLLLTALYAVVLRREHPPSAFSAAWWLAALLPAANIIPLYIPMAERYVYLATAGAAWAAASALALLYERRPDRLGKSAVALGFLLVAAYGLRTHRRNADWRDDKALFLSASGEVPLSSMARFNRGETLRAERRFPEAAQEYEQAVSLRPGYAEGWLGLAAAYGQMGVAARAEQAYEKALALAPQNPVMSLAYALHLTRAGQNQRAVEMFQHSIAVEPEYAEAWLNFGILYQRMKRPSDALACYEKAAAFAPKNPWPRYYQGTLLELRGDKKAAAAKYRAALERDPGFEPAQALLARKASDKGRR